MPIPQTAINGTVLRGHAGGHLVHCDGPDVDLLCTSRGRLKKERISVITGDKVDIAEIDRDSGTGVIVQRRSRINQLSRPVIANVDTPVVTQAIHQPEWNAVLCDRYLVHVQLELPGITPIICINKCDLAGKDEEKNIQNIYEPLGYIVFFVSASTGKGIDALAKTLSGKISVLIGPSGVGKSSIINRLDPDLKLRIGVMENQYGVGRSTTAYSKLFPIKIGLKKGLASWVADTPGFGLSELRHPEPAEVVSQYPEISSLAQRCKYADCLHVVEDNCKVLANLSDPKQIASSRYASYLAIVTDSIKEQKLRRSRSSKIEANIKTVGGIKEVPRLERKYRISSRRQLKQQLLAAETEETE